MEIDKLLQQFYTAKEAQKILDMTADALDHAVATGLLVRVKITGKRARITKASVDALAERQASEMLAALEPDRPLIFRQFEETDADAYWRLSSTYYGPDIVEKHRNRSPDEQTYLLFDGWRLVALFSMLSLTPRGIERFSSALGWELNIETLPLEPGSSVNMVGLLMIAPGLRGISIYRRACYVRHFLAQLGEVFTSWGREGIDMRTISSNFAPLTLRQTSTLVRAGFVEHSSNAKRHIYKLDVTSATLPLLSGYKAALAEYKATH